MSDNKETSKGRGVQIAVEIPYLALFSKIVSESASPDDFAAKISAVIKKDIDWDTMISGYKGDSRLQEMILLSFPRDKETEGLAFGLMTLSASNTFFNTSKDVQFTGKRVYTSLALAQSVWEFGGNKDMLNEFDPVSSLELDKFTETVNTLASELSIIPVAEEISFMHGRFSKDTWNMLSSIVGRPVTTQMFSSGMDGDTPVFGTLVIIGDGIESLSLAVSKMIDSDVPHIKKDMSELMKSFVRNDNEKGK